MSMRFKSYFFLFLAIASAIGWGAFMYFDEHAFSVVCILGIAVFSSIHNTCHCKYITERKKEEETVLIESVHG